MNSDKNFKSNLSTVLAIIFGMLLVMVARLGYAHIPGSTAYEKISFFQGEPEKIPIVESKKHFFMMYEGIKEIIDPFVYELGYVQTIDQENLFRKEYVAKTDNGTQTTIILQNKEGIETLTLLCNAPYESTDDTNVDFSLMQDILHYVSGVKLGSYNLFDRRETCLETKLEIPYRDAGNANELICAESERESLWNGGQADFYYKLVILEDLTLEERVTINAYTRYYN